MDVTTIAHNGLAESHVNVACYFLDGEGSLHSTALSGKHHGPWVVQVTLTLVVVICLLGESIRRDREAVKEGIPVWSCAECPSWTTDGL
jgi:hypothetical protein